MITHVFRLLPGQDLLLEVSEYLKTNKIQAAVILSCVGSLTQTTLRYAGANNSTVQNGLFEILSLSGTLSHQGCHLHLSVANQEGKSFGGHLLKGNIVYTTAEISVLELNDVIFSRELDPLTGFRELHITKSIK